MTNKRNLKRFSRLSFLAVFMLFVAAGLALAVEITLDGETDDWDSSSVVQYPDPAEFSEASPIDISALAATNDAENLYVLVTTYGPKTWSTTTLPYLRGYLCVNEDINTGTGRAAEDANTSYCSLDSGWNTVIEFGGDDSPEPPLVPEALNFDNCNAAPPNSSCASEGVPSYQAASDLEDEIGITEIAIPLDQLAAWNVEDRCAGAAEALIPIQFTLDATYIDDNVVDTAQAYWEVDCASMSTTIAFLNATCTADMATVSWITLSEEETEGFYLYRSATLQQPADPTSDFIPAQNSGMPQGASYEWNDPTAVNGTAYYWLEVVDTSGNTVVGPISVSDCGSVTAVTLDDLTVTSPVQALPVAFGVGVGLLFMLIVAWRRLRPATNQ